MNRKLGVLEVAAAFVVVGLSLAAHATGRGVWSQVFAVVSLAVFLVQPLLIFVHELGHAVAAVALTGQRVLIRIGGEPYMVRFALGKIDVRFHPSGYVAHCELNPARMSPGDLLIVVLAGPAASVALAMALIPLALAWWGDSAVLFWIAAFAAASSLLMGLGNAVPFRRLPSWWPGSPRPDKGPSDGFLALQVLRARRDPQAKDWAEDRGPDLVPARPVMTQAVRAVIAMAADEAAALGRPYVGTEHLLLGLLREREAPACRVLQSCGLTTERVRAQLAQSIGERQAMPAQHLPLTPATRRTFDRARQALSLRGDECVDTEHVLLCLLQERDGLAIGLLDQLNVDPNELRRETMLVLQEGTKASRPVAPAPGTASRATG